MQNPHTMEVIISIKIIARHDPRQFGATGRPFP